MPSIGIAWKEAVLVPVITWLKFAAILVIALAVPGPDFVIVTQAATRSTRRGLTTAAGIVAGLCLWAVLAIAGIGSLLASRPDALAVLKFSGAIILMWLGISMLRTGHTRSNQTTRTGKDSRGFVRAFLTNATNPKALLFFAAILPEFIGRGPGSAGRTVVLAATVVLVSAVWWTVTVLVIGTLGVSRSARTDRVVSLVGGLTLIAIATALTVQMIADPNGHFL